MSILAIRPRNNLNTQPSGPISGSIMGTAARVDHHCASVRLVKPDGETAGLGVLVDAQKVLTCAHVVNVALGIAVA